jgi:transposase
VSTNGVISTGPRRRRHRSELFKAEAVGVCQQEGVSIFVVALARGVNASLLRRWVSAAEGSRAPIAIQRTAPVMATESPDGFVPVPMCAHRRGSMSVQGSAYFKEESRFRVC